MGLFTVKKSIENYIRSQIFVDEWGVKAPQNIPKIIDGVYYPSVAGIMVPVSDYSLGQDGLVLTNSQAKFGCDIAWRFNGEASFSELPINLVENLVDWVSHLAVCRPNIFSDLVYDCIVDRTANPVMISRTDTEDRDWLIYGFLRWTVSFRSKPIDPNTLGILQPDIDRGNSIFITSIGIKTYNQIVESNLDKIIMIPGLT